MVSTQTTQNQQPHLVTGQEVGDLQPEHFGQLGEVLWPWVAASGFPGLGVLPGYAKRAADIG